MADTMIARPPAEATQPAEDAAVKDASKSKQASTTAAANQPRKVRFNVGSNYKVLEIIGEGVRTVFSTTIVLRVSLVYMLLSSLAERVPIVSVRRLMVSWHQRHIALQEGKSPSRRSRRLIIPC
jgi:hypothetical protein